MHNIHNSLVMNAEEGGEYMNTREQATLTYNQATCYKIESVINQLF